LHSPFGYGHCPAFGAALFCQTFHQWLGSEPCPIATGWISHISFPVRLGTLYAGESIENAAQPGVSAHTAAKLTVAAVRFSPAPLQSTFQASLRVASLPCAPMQPAIDVAKPGTATGAGGSVVEHGGVAPEAASAAHAASSSCSPTASGMRLRTGAQAGTPTAGQQRRRGKLTSERAFFVHRTWSFHTPVGSWLDAEMPRS
jgi:hypothetical protein